MLNDLTMTTFLTPQFRYVGERLMGATFEFDDSDIPLETFLEVAGNQLKTYYEISQGLQWVIGDACCALRTRYSHDWLQVIESVDDLASGYRASSIKNMMGVASHIPFGQRYPELPYSFHACAAWDGGLIVPPHIYSYEEREFVTNGTSLPLRIWLLEWAIAQQGNATARSIGIQKQLMNAKLAPRPRRVGKPDHATPPVERIRPWLDTLVIDESMPDSEPVGMITAGMVRAIREVVGDE